MSIIARMSDDKPKPGDDLKRGIGLLFRAVKGAVGQISTDKIDNAVKDGVKEVGRAFENVGNELDKMFHKTTGSAPQQPPAPPPAPPPPTAEAPTEAKKDEHYDDAYAPEPPKGPRV
ncbi:MAG: hypothetical protein FWD69_14770 [Polyangiaceae bacterium]|nr:hypothetical protein [Polyangiaceae bacterium]